MCSFQSSSPPSLLARQSRNTVETLTISRAPMTDTSKDRQPPPSVGLWLSFWRLKYTPHCREHAAARQFTFGFETGRGFPDGLFELRLKKKKNFSMNGVPFVTPASGSFCECVLAAGWQLICIAGRCKVLLCCELEKARSKRSEKSLEGLSV